MMRSKFLFLGVLGVSLGGGLAQAQSPSPSPYASPSAVATSAAQSASSAGDAEREFRRRLSEGDLFFKERQSAAQLRKAREVYKALLEIRPEDPELQWRYAMGCYGVGVRATSDSKEKVALFEEGARVGLKAVEKNPKCVPCLFWTAINRVLYANEVGAVKLLFALNEVQGWARRVIELEPGYAQGGAHRLLGQIEQGVPGILGGSNRRAREHYEAAVRVAPDEPMNYMALARLLYEELDEKEAALGIARKGITVPPLARDRVEGNEAREELRALLKTWEGKTSPLPSPSPSATK